MNSTNHTSTISDKDRKRITLAKIDKGYEDFDWLTGFWYGRLLHGSSRTDNNWHLVPDYLDSYDAIIPLLQKQSTGVKFQVLIVLGKNHYAWPDSTPAQIAESLLEVLEKQPANPTSIKEKFTKHWKKVTEEPENAKPTDAEINEELIRHIWVHSNYPHNGYNQMTTEQKKRYCQIIGGTYNQNVPYPFIK